MSIKGGGSRCLMEKSIYHPSISILILGTLPLTWWLVVYTWIRDFGKIWVVWGLWYRRGVKATKGDSEDLLTYMSTFTCYSEYFCYTMDNTRKWCTQNFQFWVCGWDSQSLITFLYQFIVGASARTLWCSCHRLIFRTCLIPIFRANSLLTHRLQDTQDGQCPLEGIFFHHRDRRCSSGTWERLESLKAAEYFNSSLTAQLSTLLAAGCFPPWASLPDRRWVYRGKQRIQRMVGVSKYECDVKSYQWNLASLTLIGWW